MTSFSMKFVKNLLLASCTLICLSLVDTGLLKTDRDRNGIIHGDKANKEQFPYIMLIYWTEMLEIRCTAFLISDSAALTAAHCVSEDDKIFSTDLFHGAVGFTEMEHMKYTVKFREFRVHEEYELYINDIAILILSEPIKISKFVKPIALPGKNIKFEGQLVTAVGWGDHCFGFRCATRYLRYMKTVVAKSNNVCFAFFPDMDYERNICVEQKEKVCVYQGDSGSPIVKAYPKMDVSIGILSYGLNIESCSRVPAIYMSTSAYYEWIMQNAVGDIVYVNS